MASAVCTVALHYITLSQLPLRYSRHVPDPPYPAEQLGWLSVCLFRVRKRSWLSESCNHFSLNSPFSLSLSLVQFILRSGERAFTSPTGHATWLLLLLLLVLHLTSRILSIDWYCRWRTIPPYPPYSSLAQSQSIKNVYRELQQLITRSTNKQSNLCITLRPTHLIYIHFRRSVPYQPGAEILLPQNPLSIPSLYLFTITSRQSS